jgi:hypothetical protein
VSEHDESDLNVLARSLGLLCAECFSHELTALYSPRWVCDSCKSQVCRVCFEFRTGDKCPKRGGHLSKLEFRDIREFDEARKLRDEIRVKEWKRIRAAFGEREPETCAICREIMTEVRDVHTVCDSCGSYLCSRCSRMRLDIEWAKKNPERVQMPLMEEKYEKCRKCGRALRPLSYAEYAKMWSLLETKEETRLRHKHEKEREQAVLFLAGILSERTKKRMRDAIKKNGGYPPPFWHLFPGMSIRNALREAGFTSLNLEAEWSLLLNAALHLSKDEKKTDFSLRRKILKARVSMIVNNSWNLMGIFLAGIVGYFILAGYAMLTLDPILILLAILLLWVPVLIFWIMYAAKRLRPKRSNPRKEVKDFHLHSKKA